MRWLRPCCLFGGLLALWQLACALALVNPLFLPSPLEVADKARQLAQDGRVFADLSATLRRALAGFGLASCLGIPAGLVLGANDRLFAYCELPIEYFRSIPPVVVFPLALLVCGIGEASRMAVVTFGCLPILLISVAVGVRSGSGLRRDVARAMGARRWRLFWCVIVPESLPHVFVGARVALSMALIIAVVTEMLVGARQGLGGRVTAAQIAYDIPELYCAIIIVGLAGLGLNKLCGILQSRVVHWQ